MNPDRRQFLALGVGALAVATLPRALRRGPKLVRRQIPLMGTVAEVAVLHRDDVWAQRGIDAAFAELRWVEANMSRFRSDSDIGRLNVAAGEPVRVSSDTAEVLAAALEWAERSGGRFDPCLGRVIELWDLENRTEPPGDADVAHFAGRELWRTLDVERGDSPRVRIHAPEARIDLGGIAKGFGVDQAVRALRDMGVLQGLVNVGGDLVALGADAHGDPWRVGVRSPEDASEVMEVLEVSDAAVATSGDYLQYFENRGRRYHHMLDPRTGRPRRTPMRSLTVEAATCMQADAAATALFGADDATLAVVAHESPEPIRIAHRA